MTTLFAAFSAVSLGMIVAGDASTRILGIATLVMFGGGGSAWIVGEFVSKPSPARMDTINIPGRGPSHALVVPIKTGKARAAVVAQGAVAVASLIFFLNPTALGTRSGFQWFFGGIALLLTIAVVSAVRGWRGGEPMVAVTPSGIFSRDPQGHAFVPWQGTSGATPFEIYGQPFLGIVLNGSAPVERSGGRKLLGFLERPLAGWEFSIPLVGLALANDEVIRVIEHYGRNPDQRPTLGRSDLAAALAPIRDQSPLDDA